MASEQIRVLIAVVDPACRKALDDALGGEAGYTWTGVESAVGALAALQAERWDVLLLELPLPDADGLEAVALVRTVEPTLPLVVIAGPEDEPLALRALRQGAADYLLKGQLFPTVVRRALRYTVERQRAQQRRRRDRRALAASERRYRGLFEQSRDAIYMTDQDGRLVEANRAALELLGGGPAELRGRPLRDLCSDPADGDRLHRDVQATGHVRDFEIRVRRPDGAERWGLVTTWIHRDRRGAILGYQGIIHDISARKEVEQRLTYEAFHDPLTGLPNRALFLDRLERALARRRRSEARDLAVLFLDLDRFKTVNDSLGHAVGDEMLRRLAELLGHVVREEDTVARIGGDEFAILIDGVDDTLAPSHVAERISDRLRQPLRIGGHDLFASFSIGIAFGDSATERPEDLLRDADAAMYRAKRRGQGRHQVFDQDMHVHAATLLELETDLRRAIQRGELLLHYQPVMDLERQRPAGFEALVRWRHPRRGLLFPQAFIPIAEDTGVIVTLGEWVLREATRQLASWRRDRPGRDDLYVSVNLSPRQLSRSGLVGSVRDAIDRAELPGSALRLELTESTFVDDANDASRILGQFHDMGVGLCIDDFGTGYSGLGYLRTLPIDMLKVDRSFIRQIEDDDDDAMAGAILALARTLDLLAVAEGVETQRQLTRLRDLGYVAAQGSACAAPLEPLAAAAFLDRSAPSH